MTFPEPRLERPLDPPDPGSANVQDVIPPTERGQDAATTEQTHELTLDGSRPLTEAERKAADRDAGVGERVYAPASERVPREPVPGHRDFVDHTDTSTPERQAAHETSPLAEPSSVGPGGSEPSFTRVARPSDASPTSSEAGQMWNQSMGNRRMWWMPMAWATSALFWSAVGIWLWMRWRRERNKPINRIRRQARQTAADLRSRMPDPDEAARPAVGLSTALISVLLLVWQQSRSRSGASDRIQPVRSRASSALDRTTRSARGAAQTISDIDWQTRLAHLKERWTPTRVELEKTSISRH